MNRRSLLKLFCVTPLAKFIPERAPRVIIDFETRSEIPLLGYNFSKTEVAVSQWYGKTVLPHNVCRSGKPALQVAMKITKPNMAHLK